MCILYIYIHIYYIFTIKFATLALFNSTYLLRQALTSVDHAGLEPEVSDDLCQPCLSKSGITGVERLNPELRLPLLFRSWH